MCSVHYIIKMVCKCDKKLLDGLVTYFSSECLVVTGSQLLEVSDGARRHAAENFPAVLAELCLGMKTLLGGKDLCMVHRQQQLHVLIKVLILMSSVIQPTKCTIFPSKLSRYVVGQNILTEFRREKKIVNVLQWFSL